MTRENSLEAASGIEPVYRALRALAVLLRRKRSEGEIAGVGSLLLPAGDRDWPSEAVIVCLARVSCVFRVS